MVSDARGVNMRNLIVGVMLGAAIATIVISYTSFEKRITKLEYIQDKICKDIDSIMGKIGPIHKVPRK